MTDDQLTELSRVTLVAVITTILFAVFVIGWAVEARAESNLEIVASVIAAEACGEGEKGMHAVGSTILNRSKSRRISPARVVQQRNQYFGWTAGNRARLYAQCRDVANRIAAQVLAGTLVDVTNGSEYFLLPGEPVRRWHGEKTVTIGAHTFYKERGK